jgi:AcrR family transcriptional regulator
MREAILESAFDLFSRKGYTPTTMAEIARTSNMTVANLYVYFDSKLSILYEIYQPWLEQQLAALAESVRKFRTPKSRLRRIFIGIWSDIPAADHSFANALIEALAVAPKGMAKPNTLLIEVESFLTGLIAECLPEEQAHLVQDDLLAHVIWMAFDGFVINQHLGDLRDIGSIADIMTNLLMDGGVGKSGAETEAPVKRTRKKVEAK